jgi:hypothetical protein
MKWIKYEGNKIYEIEWNKETRKRGLFILIKVDVIISIYIYNWY